MSSLTCKNVRLQDPTGTLVSTLSFDGTNVVFGSPVIMPYFNVLVSYTASNVTVSSNQSHSMLITNADPSWYLVYNLHVTPSNTQASYTISIYNGDASQSSVTNDKSNLVYLSANNSGELLDSVPFAISGSSNNKSIVIANNSDSTDNTFNVVLTAVRHSLPTTVAI
jgi:hypothetical protein